MAENLARDRAKQLFGAAYADVQRHSGTQANMVIYFTFLELGAKVLGMNLSHGGNLTGGSPVNFSGQLYRLVAYGVDAETEMIDYEEVAKLAEANARAWSLSAAAPTHRRSTSPASAKAPTWLA